MDISTLPSQDNALSMLQGHQLALLGWRRIARIRRLVLALPWIGFFGQCLLAHSGQDVLCALLAASGAFLVFFDAFRPKRFYRYPLSTLVVLGFAVTLQLGPLLFTALEGRAITFNLMVPIDTFGHSLLASVICLLAHAIYRKVHGLGRARKALNRLLVWLRLFQPPRSSEVIAMGSVGVFALAVSTLFSQSEQADSIVVKFVQGFQFFSVIPAAFLLQGLIGKQSDPGASRSKSPLLLFLVFLGLIVFVAIGRNARAPFVVPVACVLMGFALEWLYGLIWIRLRAVIALVLAIVLLLPLATDLATAMVMVRGLRGDIPPAELIDQTLVQLQDREEIHRFRVASSESGLAADWSENYVDNLFLARFANAKFPDNSLENSAGLQSSAREEMAAFQWWRLLATLPGPVLTILGVPVAKKEEVTSFSFGDKLYALASGSPYALGGFRTGHFFGTGMAGFGFGYLLILLAALLLIFPLVDAHAAVAARGVVGVPLISAVAITQLVSWFTFSNAESVVSLLSFPLRGFIEPVLLFALARRLLSRV